MVYHRCGRRGSKLPAVSLGHWHNFGKIFKQDLVPFRDELLISPKAGYDMWPGLYRDWGSLKYLLSGHTIYKNLLNFLFELYFYC